MMGAPPLARPVGGRTLPASACDAHSHIYGPGAEFPYVAERTYEPVDTPVDAYRAHAAALGLERAVFVQPAVHGADHAAMLDALQKDGRHYAGVALVGCEVSDATLAMLDASGVRGARFNFMPHLGPPPERAEMRALARRLAALGWHLCLHLDMVGLRERADAIAALECPVVIDHMARISCDAPTFADDLALLTDLLTGSEVWIKLSGADRAVQGAADLAKMIPVMAQLYDAAPDRCLWGCEWPHPNVRWQPEDRALLDLVLTALPDDRAIAQVFVDNPGRLYFRNRLEPT